MPVMKRGFFEPSSKLVFFLEIRMSTTVLHLAGLLLFSFVLGCRIPGGGGPRRGLLKRFLGSMLCPRTALIANRRHPLTAVSPHCPQVPLGS